VFQVVVQLHCAKESPPPFALTFSANRTEYHTLDVQISNGLLLDVRIQVPITPPLFISRVPDHIIDDTLVHAFARQSRDERVSEHMPPFEYVPLRHTNCTLKVIVGLARGNRLPATLAEQRLPGGPTGKPFLEHAL